MRKLFGLWLLAVVVGGCSTRGSETPVGFPAPPHPGQACHAAGAPTPPNVVFLAKEESPEELDGLDYFVQDWGARQGCLKGLVLTSLHSVDPSRYTVLVVDVSHDQQLSAEDRDGIQAFIAKGRRVAVFAWPVKLSDGSVIGSALGGVPALLGAGQLKAARTCGDWQYGDQLQRPFELQKTSYRYENFADAIFTVNGGGGRSLATTLFCPADPGPVMVETPAGTLAGFYLAYSLSLADNNVRSVGMKRMLVDLVQKLSLPMAA